MRNKWMTQENGAVCHFGLHSWGILGSKLDNLVKTMTGIEEMVAQIIGTEAGPDEDLLFSR